MNEYLFDAKLFISVRVKGETAYIARKKLKDLLDCADINLGAIDGDEVVCEGSIDAEDGFDLIEVNGEAV